MAAVQDPSVQRRRLRTELRRARDAAGFKQADVAKAMDWSPSKIIRIESGQVSISTNDLRALLEHYRVRDRGRVTSLLEMAKNARASSFYDGYPDVLKPGFREYLAFESSATVIRQWEPILVPGLLQTEEYARAILTGVAGLDSERAERAWAVRQHRQELHDREDAPEMRFLIDESCVRREVRGRTMTRQLERLREFADADHITLQVVPFSAGEHPGMGGSFVNIEFSEPDLDDLVHLESVDDVTIKDDPEVIGHYSDRFEAIEKVALSPEDTVALIEELLGGHEHAEVESAAVAG